MAYSLLELNNGNWSLEFDESDIPSVSAAIRELFSDFQEKKGVIANELGLDGAKLIFSNEWGLPCILASCEVGGTYLKQLHGHLHESVLSAETQPD